MSLLPEPNLNFCANVEIITNVEESEVVWGWLYSSEARL